MKLDKEKQRIVEIIKELALQKNLNVYIVGGVVRDLIMGNKIKDIDFLVEGSAIGFVQSSGLKIKSIHEDFDTAKVEINGIEVDIASTRKEVYPEMGMLPRVIEVGIKIEEDLKRRDFTINSIGINLQSGEIVDPYCGKADIESGVLRVLHDKSFLDDPTRILRGFDFKYRFNFKFDEKTKHLMDEAKTGYNRSNLSIDRIYLTLNKIFSSKNADKILSDIIEGEIYKIWTDKIGIKKEEIPELEEAIRIFKINEKEKLYLMALENCPYVKAGFKDRYEIYNFFKNFTPLQLAFYYFKTKDKSAVEFLKLKDIKPLITGKILIEQGFMEGEIIGVILNSILKEKILNPKLLKTAEDEINFALKKFIRAK